MLFDQQDLDMGGKGLRYLWFRRKCIGTGASVGVAPRPWAMPRAPTTLVAPYKNTA
jgi:hypothetical protein